MPCATVSSRHVCVCSVAQFCLTLCNPMDCSPAGPSVDEISQDFPRIFPASLAVSRVGRQRFFTTAPPGKAQFQTYNIVICYFYTSQKPPACFEIPFLLKGTRALWRKDGFQRWGRNYKVRSAIWCWKTRQCANNDANVSRDTKPT